MKHNITLTEKKVLMYTAQGLSNKEIAELLNISRHTVKSVESKIFRKLDAKNRANAVYIAAKENLID